jgi:hypothetical protein
MPRVFSCVARFSSWRCHAGIVLYYGCGCSRDGDEVHGVSRWSRHGQQGANSLIVFMGKCYAAVWIRHLSWSYAKNLSVTTGGQCEYDNFGWCNKSKNYSQVIWFWIFGPSYKNFHWTVSLLSEVPEWEFAEGGASRSLVFSPRWHCGIIPWRTDARRCLETRTCL